MQVELTKKARVRRSFRVILDEREHSVEYRGDGPGYEAAVVDGRVAVKQRSLFRMAPLFEFDVGGHQMRFEVESTFWMNLFAFLWPGHLRRFAYFVDDCLVYEDRFGREVS